MRRLVWAAAAVGVVATGCTTTRRLGRADWGALRGDERIVVVTAGGVRQELHSFQFFNTGVVGWRDGESVVIPLDSITLVEVRAVSTAATALAVLGVGTAVGVVIALTKSPERPPPPTSCPFVYSFDGEEYRLDSETFAGAAAKGLDRTDYDNLEHARALNGRYRLRLVNERPETHYTDELKLLVVDHPPGTQVIPGRTGKVHVIASPRPPLVARGVRGEDALADVRGADGNVWRGAPVETADLDDPAELRDGLVVSFARPPGTRSARVVVRARNTELAPFALQSFLQLQGDELFAWYDRVARDSALRQRIRRWVAREGMLHVFLWQDGQWILQDALLDVGPALSKSQVVQLDLNAVKGDTVVVKFESARALWEIDWIAMDTGEEPAITVREIEPRWARDEQRRDLTAILASEDGRYYASVQGGAAEIEFAVPGGAPNNWARSVILKSRGFYYVYVPHSGPSQSALADRMLDEPLWGNRYVLEQWRATRR